MSLASNKQVGFAIVISLAKVSLSLNFVCLPVGGPRTGVKTEEAVDSMHNTPEPDAERLKIEGSVKKLDKEHSEPPVASGHNNTSAETPEQAVTPEQKHEKDATATDLKSEKGVVKSEKGDELDKETAVTNNDSSSPIENSAGVSKVDDATPAQALKASDAAQETPMLAQEPPVLARETPILAQATPNLAQETPGHEENALVVPKSEANAAVKKSEEEAAAVAAAAAAQKQRQLQRAETIR